MCFFLVAESHFDILKTKFLLHQPFCRRNTRFDNLTADDISQTDLILIGLWV